MAPERLAGRARRTDLRRLRPGLRDVRVLHRAASLAAESAAGGDQPAAGRRPAAAVGRCARTCRPGSTRRCDARWTGIRGSGPPPPVTWPPPLAAPSGTPAAPGSATGRPRPAALETAPYARPGLPPPSSPPPSATAPRSVPQQGPPGGHPSRRRPAPLGCRPDVGPPGPHGGPPAARPSSRRSRRADRRCTARHPADVGWLLLVAGVVLLARARGRRRASSARGRVGQRGDER